MGNKGTSKSIVRTCLSGVGVWMLFQCALLCAAALLALAVNKMFNCTFTSAMIICYIILFPGFRLYATSWIRKGSRDGNV